MPTIDYTIIGTSGLKEYGGYVDEEFNPKLKGTKAIKVYTEMSENDAVVGAILFCIEMLCRQVKWEMSADEDDKPGQEASQFVTECMDDMSHTWESTISEVLTMLKFGWSYFELVYKVRQGDSEDPRRRSKYTDGKYGWRKIALRSQDSLLKWVFQDDGGIAGMWQQPVSGPTVFIPIEKALLFRTKENKNNPEGKSILRNAYRSWYFLKRLQEIEAIGFERNLTGLPKMQVPLNLLISDATDSDKSLLNSFKDMLRDIRKDERGYIIVPPEQNEDGQPSGYKFELIASPGNQGSGDIDKAITRYEQRIAMSVLAEFILLGLDKVGSFSLVSSKTNLFATALTAWLDSIAAVFNMFAIPRLLKVNGYKLEKNPVLKHGSVQDVSLDELGNFFRNTGLGISLSDMEMENYLRGKINAPLKKEETIL